MRRVAATWAMASLTIGLVAASCAGNGGGEGGEGGTTAITVFAAASLTDAFGELAEAYTAEHPGTTVTTNFAGSADLAAQILQGAPADVFVSADVINMDELVDADAISGIPRTFATNRSAIMVESGNPLGIGGLGDLTDRDLVVVTCAPEVPCGSYARQIFDRAGVDVRPDSFETNVKGVVTKVTIGEADAGIVYATDVLAAGDDAAGVAIPDDVNVVATYPIAVTADADDPDASGDFVDFVLGDEGQRILADYGFGAP